MNLRQKTSRLVWYDFFKKLALPPTQFFGIFIPSFKKGGWLETICISLKIYETIFASFCVLLMEHFDFFLMILLLFAVFDMVFCKDFPTFLWTNKTRQAVGSILPPKITSLWKLFKLNTPTGLLSSWEVKTFGWFTHIGYKRTQFRVSFVWHGFILCTIYKHKKYGWFLAWE